MPTLPPTFGDSFKAVFLLGLAAGSTAINDPQGWVTLWCHICLVMNDLFRGRWPAMETESYPNPNPNLNFNPSQYSNVVVYIQLWKVSPEKLRINAPEFVVSSRWSGSFSSGSLTPTSPARWLFIVFPAPPDQCILRNENYITWGETKCKRKT